jgi:hypothetical protein
MKKLIVKIALPVLLLATSVYAQKLPNVQTISVRAPKDIKIDGKATEWNNFQAYNKSVQVFYTIANDDDNLYLVLQSSSRVIANKIMGGVTFTIAPTQNKKNKNNISIIYPVKASKYPLKFPMKKSDMPDTTLKGRDSAMKSFNNRLLANHTTIRIAGISGLDSTLSVYNDDDISAAGLFDNKIVYTCEISVPLKYISFAANGTKFFYNIKLNGTDDIAIPITTTITPGDARAAAVQRMFDKGNEAAAAMSTPTDFWGEYILGKRP